MTDEELIDKHLLSLKLVIYDGHKIFYKKKIDKKSFDIFLV